METVDRKPIQTLALWVEQEDWLKDLRQWWRKIGRRTWKKSEALDAVTGATRKPRNYKLKWKLDNIEHDELVLHFEAVRERGGRSHSRTTINLRESKEYVVAPSEELGVIKIQVKAG